MPTSKNISFTGSGGARLAAIMDLPDGDPECFAVFAHCFTCSKDFKAAHHTSRALAGRGIAVLRFDFSGLGQSEGEFAETSFSSNIDDLARAAEHLRYEHQAPRLLVGHSLGGAAALAAAADLPEVAAVATIAAPFDPRHVERHLEDAAGAGEHVEIQVAGRSFRLKRGFFEDLKRHDMARKISDLDRALLVCHSPLDRVVHPQEAERIFQTARHPKSFLALEGADHLLSRRADAEYAGRVIAEWARPYLA